MEVEDRRAWPTNIPVPLGTTVICRDEASSPVQYRAIRALHISNRFDGMDHRLGRYTACGLVMATPSKPCLHPGSTRLSVELLAYVPEQRIQHHGVYQGVHATAWQQYVSKIRRSETVGSVDLVRYLWMEPT